MKTFALELDEVRATELLALMESFKEGHEKCSFFDRSNVGLLFEIDDDGRVTSFSYALLPKAAAKNGVPYGASFGLEND